MDVLSVGEMFVDFLPGDCPGSYLRNAGGAPANVAIAVARNGLATGFLGKLGDDDLGRFLADTLKENGVEMILKTFAREAVTTMTFVSLRSDGERSFTFVRKPGADMLLTEDEIDAKVVASATVVHAGSCSLSQPPASEATLKAMRLGKEAGRLVSFDVNYRPPLWDNEAVAVQRLEAALPLVDLLKVSEEEVHLVGGSDALSRRAGELGIAVAVETRGRDGARCHFAGTTLEAPAVPAPVVDTTAAGDAFWGAFLAHLLLNGVARVGDLSVPLLQDALGYAAAAGSLCVRRKGVIAALPDRAEILALLAARKDDC